MRRDNKVIIIICISVILIVSVMFYLGTKPVAVDTDLVADIYMKKVQKQIKANWDPPSGMHNKQVVTFFTVAKDGSLLSSEIKVSSDDKKFDDSALSAIRNSAPFEPIPDKVFGDEDKDKSRVDVQFVFDYNKFLR